MKIAQIASTFPPYEGGTGNVCYQQSESLAALGHNVTVFLPKTNDSSLNDEHHHFTIKYIPSLFSVGNASFIPKLMSELQGFDIIHLHYPFFGGDVFVRQAARRNRIPYVLTYHQDIHGDSFFKKVVFTFYNKLFQKSILSGAKKIFALSKEHIENSRIAYVTKIPGKVTIIPNGVNLKDFDSRKTKVDIRKKFNIKPGVPLIAFIGALDNAHYFKRVDILIESLKIINTEAHLMIIGDGDLKNKYIQLATELNLLHRIAFVGKISNIETISYLRQTDLLVLPSVNTESFGIVLIEAMACGIPVIASDLPAMHAVVTNNVNGLLFKKGSVADLAKKIEYIITSPTIAHNMGENGKQTVKIKYEWKTIARTLEEVYEKCINYAH